MSLDGEGRNEDNTLYRVFAFRLAPAAQQWTVRQESGVRETLIKTTQYRQNQICPLKQYNLTSPQS